MYIRSFLTSNFILEKESCIYQKSFHQKLYQPSRHVKFIPQCNLISPVLRFIYREIYDQVALGDLYNPSRCNPSHFSLLDISRLISGQIKGNDAYIFSAFSINDCMRKKMRICSSDDLIIDEWRKNSWFFFDRNSRTLWFHYILYS